MPEFNSRAGQASTIPPEILSQMQQRVGAIMRGGPQAMTQAEGVLAARVAELTEEVRELRRMLAEARAQEREACAKLCDPEPMEPWESYTTHNNKVTMRLLAKRIRARTALEDTHGR